MSLEYREHTPTHPAQTIEVRGFPAGFSELFDKPDGLIEDWPPAQVKYLEAYLSQLGCQTVVVESHYIDRDFVDDVALFYSRSLRNYPNYCRRAHFFRKGFDQQRWRALVTLPAATEADKAARDEAFRFLRTSYLGFLVQRPLAGAPVGRTVLSAHSAHETSVSSEFNGTRTYTVHLAGLELVVEGLAFQQQDRGVSACATTALWSALQAVAPLEGLPVPTPADITEAASRYTLPGGRPLPSDGLTTEQICEAARAAGLAPLLVQGSSRSGSPERDRAQILAYVSSGLPAVLAVEPLPQPGGRPAGNEGHAVCAVGVRLGGVAPRTDHSILYRDMSSALRGVYVHDDRYGPYAYAELGTLTIERKNERTNETWSEIRTLLTTHWPDRSPAKLELLKAIIVPVPPKLRLTAGRMRELAHYIAQVVAKIVPTLSGEITMNCRYSRAVNYREGACKHGLSGEGLYKILCGLALSRYVGVIELTVRKEPLLDVLLDTTETEFNPSVLAMVARQSWPKNALVQLEALARVFDAYCVV